MKLSSLRPSSGGAPARDAWGREEEPPVVTIRPARAAFGPHVSLVSVDDNGRLWVRLSTAVGVMVAGLALLVIPLLALWYAGVGLLDSGQVDLEERDRPGRYAPPVPGKNEPVRPGGSPTELPLANSTRNR